MEYRYKDCYKDYIFYAINYTEAKKQVEFIIGAPMNPFKLFLFSNGKYIPTY